MKKNSKDFLKNSLEAFKKASSDALNIKWPSEKYQNDPVKFAIDILGIDPWDKQIEILEGVRDNKRVAVKSGHKVGKSNSAAILALWFYCSFDDARVILTSSTARQVREVLWREISKMYDRSKRIDGKINELPASGLRAKDQRQIIGYTAQKKEDFAGTSGKNILYVFDEASGIPDEIFEAADGNMAAGARIVLFSNPTQSSGEFHAAFNKKSKFYKCITISSEETPNVIERREVIPGLASYEWIEQKKQEWGEDSPIYQIRIKGNFPDADSCTVVPFHLVNQAAERSKDQIDYRNKDYQGKISIGVDPARFGEDFTSITFRRNKHVIRIVQENGLDSKEIIKLINSNYIEIKKDRELKPIVCVDSCGGYGSGIIDYLDRKIFDVKEVNVASKSTRPSEFVRLRDELWFNITEWLKSGKCILPDNDKLISELTCPLYTFDPKNRRQVQSKDEIKKKLKRSPDFADSLALSLAADFDLIQEEKQEYYQSIKDISIYEAERNMSPYGGEISPY